VIPLIDINIGPNTTVNPLCRERLYRGAKDKALLLLHGYTGSPHNMTFLGEKIYQETNLTVYIPRLPVMEPVVMILDIAKAGIG